MPETRMLPHKKPRSTGIERVSQASKAPLSSVTGVGSHVSAAPGVGARVHEHVLAARSPAGAGNNVTRVTGRQDAKVELIDRRGASQGAPRAGGFAADAPTVQLMEQIPRRGGDPGFSVPQINLIGSLLGQYEEGVLAIGNVEDATMARDAIEKLGKMISGGAPVPASPGRQVIAATEPPATASSESAEG